MICLCVVLELLVPCQQWPATGERFSSPDRCSDQLERFVSIRSCYANGYSLQPTLAQLRMPMDRIVSGACVNFFHASQAGSTMAS